MRKICLFYLLLTKICVSVCVAQTEDLFNWSNGNVVAKEQFMKIVQDDNQEEWILHNFSSYVYKSINVGSPNERYNHLVNLYRIRELDNDYSYFTLVNEQDSSQMFFGDGEDALTTVAYLTMNPDEHNHFIHVPLDENSYALIFAGWFFSYDETCPGEMKIVVVHKNTATLVYDDRAVAISYTPAPNFSMEFVTDATGILKHTRVDPTSPALTNRTKHKIWRDGNMLKYKTWK
ncbi:MAG: hypothetical protein MJY74_05760 [Bacteroidaceae bacterium]|nr:hypothetical protein [Bacteroidaceae bacterium]